jgi:ketosteroid isomerase-like protein
MEQDKRDRQQILGHVDSIFRAFLAKDREVLRRTHTEDWVGFLGPSTAIERGIEDYMRGAEASLQNFHGSGYELLDTEVQLHGDFAVVFYVARYDYRDNDGEEHSLGLRSVDLYRRVDGRWIQSGSHITPIPEGGAWGEGNKSEAAE